MLPPAPILTGPKGGRYVETSAGRHYVDDSYGRSHLEATPAATDAAVAVQRIRDFRAEVPPGVVQVKPLAFKDMGEIWKVDTKGEQAIYNPTATAESAIRSCKEFVDRAISANDAAQKYTHAAEWTKLSLEQQRQAEEDWRSGKIQNFPGIPSGINFESCNTVTNLPNNIKQFEKEAGEARTRRDNLLALAQRVYEDYSSKIMADTHGAALKQKSPLIAYAVQKHFDDLGLGSVHFQQTTAWKASSSAENAMRLHGALLASNVPGSLGVGHDQFKIDKAAEGQKDPEMQRYVREMYSLTQAALKAEGVKELTIYRGTHDQPVEKTARPLRRLGLMGADIVRAETRPASSWTDKYAVARSFASHDGTVLKTTVPASAIYASHHLFGNYSDENEYVVLGASRFNMESVDE